MKKSIRGQIPAACALVALASAFAFSQAADQDALAVDEVQSAQVDVQAQAKRDAAMRWACGSGNAAGVWVNATTVRCFTSSGRTSYLTTAANHDE